MCVCTPLLLLYENLDSQHSVRDANIRFCTTSLQLIVPSTYINKYIAGQAGKAGSCFLILHVDVDLLFSFICRIYVWSGWLFNCYFLSYFFFLMAFLSWLLWTNGVSLNCPGLTVVCIRERVNKKPSTLMSPSIPSQENRNDDRWKWNSCVRKSPRRKPIPSFFFLSLSSSTLIVNK